MSRNICNLLLRTVIFVVVLVLFACPSEGEDSDSYYAGTNGTTGGDSPFDKPNYSVSADQYWWGKWQRMDNGQIYEISENKVTVCNSDNDVKSISSVSTDSFYAYGLGTFTKLSQRMIENNNIPYFRQGGTNLEFSLKVVGFEDTDSRSGKANYKAKYNSVKYPTFEETTESDEDGIIKGHAPVAGDEMTVTVTKHNGKTVVVPGIKVETNGSNMGTIPITNDGQYTLKVTGTVAEEAKTDGYLYAGNDESYPLTLTVTNIGDVDCASTYYEITAADSVLKVSADSGSSLSGTIPTLEKGAQKNYSLKVSCSSINDAYIDTGLNVTFSNSTGKWVDYVPLRFYKGLVPVSFAAINNDSNSANVYAALNGFVIYPDGNSKFFAVDQKNTKTLYFPSFGSSQKYMLVFCGATTSQNLSDSTEMYYTVSIGKTMAKTVKIPSSSDEHITFQTFGGDNHSEDNAYSVNSDFEALLEAKEKDFYTFAFSEDSIIDINSVPVDYWSSSASTVESLKDETMVYNVNTNVYFGTLGNSDSWVIYKFAATSGETYTVEWGDAGNTISAVTSEGSYSFDGSARLYVSASTGSSFANTFFNSKITSPQTIKASSSGDIYLKFDSWVTYKGGTFSVRVTDSAGNAKTLNLYSGSGCAGWEWTVGEFSSSTDSKIYYKYLESGKKYCLQWSDYREGFGHSADVKVSASTDLASFSNVSADSSVIFSSVNSGFNKGQEFVPANNGYVYFKVEPQSAIANYQGTYALQLKRINDEDDFSYFGLAEYNASNFAVESGEDITNNSAWCWGCIYPNGEEIFSFPVLKDNIYSVIWDDAGDGSSNYTGDVVLSAYSAYSNGTLSNPYWENTDSGYSNGNIKNVVPTENGNVYVKVVPKDASSFGTFRVAVANGPNRSLTYSITDVKSHNCNFNGYKISNNKNAIWNTGEFTSGDDDHIYCFTKPDDGRTVYKLYADTKKYHSDSQYTADSVKGYFISSVYIEDNDSSCDLAYYGGTSKPIIEAGTYYIHIKPGDGVTSGTYAFTVIDGDNNPVTLTRPATKGSDISSGWLTGTLSSKDDKIMYRYHAKKNTNFCVFWDDKKDGSGKYTADIECGVGSFDEDDVVSHVRDDGYKEYGWISSSREDKIYYFYVCVKGSKEGTASASDTGTFAIAIMEGDTPAAEADFSTVVPNTTVTLAMESDIAVISNANGTKRVFTADTGYDSYIWYIDGKRQQSSSNKLEIDISGSAWIAGTYEIEVEAKKGARYFSSTLLLKVE